MTLFQDVKLIRALKEYKFTDTATPTTATRSKEFEERMERLVRQKQRNYNLRVFSQRAAVAVIAIALFGSFFYLLLLPRNEGVLPLNTEEQFVTDEMEPTPSETLIDEDPCDCCPECTQEECICDECGDSNDCECSAQSLSYDGININVTSVEEFVNAIAPNTIITLEAGQYDISTIVDFRGPHVNWRDDYYGVVEKTLVITGADGLTLQAAPGANVEIITPWRFAEVLSFSNCNDISLIGITAGHTITGDYICDAGVISFENCSNITVDNCYLYGCGTMGIYMFNCDTGFIKDTIITDCSRAAIIISNSEHIEFSNCRFIDNRAYQYIIHTDSSTVIFNDCEISGNKHLWGGVIEIDFFGGTSDVLFDHCLIVNNAPNMEWFEGGFIFMPTLDDYAMFEGRPSITVKDCEIELGQFIYYWKDGEINDLGGNILR